MNIWKIVRLTHRRKDTKTYLAGDLSGSRREAAVPVDDGTRSDGDASGKGRGDAHGDARGDGEGVENAIPAGDIIWDILSDIVWDIAGETDSRDGVSDRVVIAEGLSFVE